MHSPSHQTAARLAVLVVALCGVPPALAADPPVQRRPAGYAPTSLPAATRPAPVVPLTPAQHHAPAAELPAPPVPSAPVAAGSALGLADLERLALQHNPTLAQAAAFIDAARGKAFQAGLPLNPSVGITGEQIGAARTAGEWTWFYLQQEIVTGGKLRLSRLKYEQEAYAAEVQACGQRLRVANAIAEGYFGMLAAQRSVENHRRLKANAEVGRVELDLRRRFADAFSRYETARAEVETWRDETLPTAQRAYDLYLKSYKERRSAWPQVLVAQRTVYQLSEDYTRSLLELRRAEVEVRGLLLTGGLTAPRDPTPAGHINSVPKPR